MATRDEIVAIRDRFLADLTRAHDYYFHTKAAWGIVSREIRDGRKLLVRNHATNTEITEAELLRLSRHYVTHELTSATLQQFVEIFEGFLYETLRAWMLAYPGSLSEQSVTGKVIFALPDKEAIVNALVEKELHGLFYKRPSEWFEKLEKLTRIGVPLKEDKVAFSEIKATRDVLIHGDGIAHAYYVEKAGKAARFQPGQIVDIPEPYHQASWDLICRLTREIGDAMAAKAT